MSFTKVVLFGFVVKFKESLPSLSSLFCHSRGGTAAHSKEKGAVISMLTLAKLERTYLFLSPQHSMYFLSFLHPFHIVVWTTWANCNLSLLLAEFWNYFWKYWLENVGCLFHEFLMGLNLNILELLFAYYLFDESTEKPYISFRVGKEKKC